MRALVLMTMAAFPVQADAIPSCPFGKNKGLLQCEDIDAAKRALLSATLPADLSGTEIQQYFNQLYFQVTLEGTPKGNEGSQVKTAICGLQAWRELLDREYRMSVRMTYQQDGFISLDEIAFIEDCEAN